MNDNDNDALVFVLIILTVLILGLIGACKICYELCRALNQ